MENEIFGVSVPLLNHGAVEMTSSSQPYYSLEEAISNLHRGAGIDGNSLLTAPSPKITAFENQAFLSEPSLTNFSVNGEAPSFRWSLDELQARSMAGFRFSSESDPSWVSNKPDMISCGVLGNELSLSLGFPTDHCAERYVDFHAPSQFHRLPSNGEQGGSSRHSHTSQTLMASPYFNAARQLLSVNAAHVIGDNGEYNNEQGTSSPGKIEEFIAPEPKTLKTDLINMLQMIDQGYSECVGRVQNVVSEFRTDSGTSQERSDSALRSVSAVYRKLRERITSQMLSLGQQLGGEFLFETEESLEYSFLQRQWALQQMKNDNQAWRPQRGLPEKSVAVLRSWMFRNFLHPYPKDSEKQLLAIKSGLTRSQVSNWFINARVRLWKPMIEDMCQEMNRNDRGEDSQEEHRNPRDAEFPAIRAS